MRAKEKLTIPIDKIVEGIVMCLKNSAQFCADAKLLCKESSCQHAFGLCLYAIEELGKAQMLKELSAHAKKKGETQLVFCQIKAKDFFSWWTPKDLKKFGFSNKERNPFYDHRYKLWFAGKMVAIATQNRIITSLGDQKFQNLSEIFDAFNEKGKDVYELNVKRVGFREGAMYVDYDQKNNKWVNGTVKITTSKIIEMIGDIEETIEMLSNMAD